MNKKIVEKQVVIPALKTQSNYPSFFYKYDRQIAILVFLLLMAFSVFIWPGLYNMSRGVDYTPSPAPAPEPPAIEQKAPEPTPAPATLTEADLAQKENNKAEYFFNQGNSYFKAGAFKESIESYRQAIRIKPDFALAQNNLSSSYNSLGMYEEAIEFARQALRIRPDFAEAHYNLGISYLLGSKDRVSALEEVKILKSLNLEMADKLLDEINK